MPRPRRRTTEHHRETRRRATTVAIVLGTEVRRARRRRRLTQGRLGALIGVSQAEVSRIERGLGVRAPLETWIALGVALERPVAIQLTRPLGDQRDAPADGGHLEIQEAVLRLARATDRPGTFETPTRPADPRRSTDVGIRDARHRARILVECWNSFGDLGEATRATHRKLAEAAATWPEDRITSVWVVRASATNRRIVARFAHVVDAAFPGSSRQWVRALTVGDIPPPREPGLVWFDPATGRLTEHRRARMTS
ncbi:MAG: helix-turn-helix transcriptional regulator [Chloroflexota bacterium]